MHDDSIKSKYHVTKVERTTAPEGMLGENNSIMDCKKTGTLKSVTAHAKGRGRNH